MDANNLPTHAQTPAGSPGAADRHRQFSLLRDKPNHCVNAEMMNGPSAPLRHPSHPPSPKLPRGITYAEATSRPSSPSTSPHTECNEDATLRQLEMHTMDPMKVRTAADTSKTSPKKIIDQPTPGGEVTAKATLPTGAADAGPKTPQYCSAYNYNHDAPSSPEQLSPSPAPRPLPSHRKRRRMSNALQNPTGQSVPTPRHVAIPNIPLDAALSSPTRRKIPQGRNVRPLSPDEEAYDGPMDDLNAYMNIDPGSDREFDSNLMWNRVNFDPTKFKRRHMPRAVHNPSTQGSGSDSDASAPMAPAAPLAPIRDLMMLDGVPSYFHPSRSLDQAMGPDHPAPPTAQREVRQPTPLRDPPAHQGQRGTHLSVLGTRTACLHPTPIANHYGGEGIHTARTPTPWEQQNVSNIMKTETLWNDERPNPIQSNTQAYHATQYLDEANWQEHAPPQQAKAADDHRSNASRAATSPASFKPMGPRAAHWKERLSRRHSPPTPHPQAAQSGRIQDWAADVRDQSTPSLGQRGPHRSLPPPPPPPATPVRREAPPMERMSQEVSGNSQETRSKAPLPAFTTARMLHQKQATPGPSAYPSRQHLPDRRNTTLNPTPVRSNLTAADQSIIQQLIAVADDDDHMVVDESALLSPASNPGGRALPPLPNVTGPFLYGLQHTPPHRSPHPAGAHPGPFAALFEAAPHPVTSDTPYPLPPRHHACHTMAPLPPDRKLRMPAASYLPGPAHPEHRARPDTATTTTSPPTTHTHRDRHMPSHRDPMRICNQSTRKPQAARTMTAPSRPLAYNTSTRQRSN